MCFGWVVRLCSAWRSPGGQGRGSKQIVFQSRSCESDVLEMKVWKIEAEQACKGWAGGGVEFGGASRVCGG